MDPVSAQFGKNPPSPPCELRATTIGREAPSPPARPVPHYPTQYPTQDAIQYPTQEQRLSSSPGTEYRPVLPVAQPQPSSQSGQDRRTTPSRPGANGDATENVFQLQSPNHSPFNGRSTSSSPNPTSIPVTSGNDGSVSCSNVTVDLRLKAPEYFAPGSKEGSSSKPSWYAGTKYQGQHCMSFGQNAMRHGYGHQEWADGSTYEGEWYENAAFGRGILRHSNGDMHIGEWRNNAISGQGSYTALDGSFYEGQWFNNDQHGYGVQLWADGSIYEGQFQKGLKSGHGIYRWPNGACYAGEWKNNLFSGPGEYQCGPEEGIEGDAVRYVGQWKASHMHGNGLYEYTDGRRYWGGFASSDRHGFGIQEWPDGSRYEGYWEKGLKEGSGVVCKARGESYPGVWSKGHVDHWTDLRPPWWFDRSRRSRGIKGELPMAVADTGSGPHDEDDDGTASGPFGMLLTFVSRVFNGSGSKNDRQE